MADVKDLRNLQDELNVCMLSLRTVNAQQVPLIRDNISNLQRQIRCLLHIVNYQMDGHVNNKIMPPPPSLKL